MPAKIKYPIVDGQKECGQCRIIKPVSFFRKARNHLTSQCTTCLKEYRLNYLQRPAIIARSTAYRKRYMSIKANRDAANARSMKYHKQPTAMAKKNLARRIWSAREKQKAVDYKGGKCCCCGYSKCLAALDFHHLDPSKKDGYGTGALKSHWTFERNKKEIDKCILICVRCHRELHAGLIKYEQTA